MVVVVVVVVGVVVVVAVVVVAVVVVDAVVAVAAIVAVAVFAVDASGEDLLSVFVVVAAGVGVYASVLLTSTSSVSYISAHFPLSIDRDFHMIYNVLSSLS